MTPTQEDREAAERSALALGGKFTCFDCIDQLTEVLRDYRLAAEERGARMEREQIVAWLRRQERLALERLDIADNPNSERNYAAGAAAVQRAADIIERGEHRQIDPASLGAE